MAGKGHTLREEGYCGYTEWSLHLLLYHGLFRTAVRDYKVRSRSHYSVLRRLLLDLKN